MKNLAHSASLHAGENNAPSKPGTKHKEWNGRELWARPLRPPDEETKDIKVTRAEVTKLERNLRSATKVFDKAGIHYDKSSFRPSGELSRLSDLRSKLAGRVPIDDGYRVESAAYQRYLAVRELLLDALADGKIVAVIPCYYGDIELRDSDWKRRKREKRGYSLELSQVEPLDGDIFDQTHQFRLIRAKFMAWLGSIRGEGTPLLRAQDAAEQYGELLESEVAMGKKIHNKPYYWEIAKAEPYKLSYRQFLKTWDSVVPAHWKSSGPTKGRKDRRTP
jgi:hypothetical protein